MDLSERDRRRLIEIEQELVLDSPSLTRAFSGWSTGPLEAERRRTTVRAAARTCRDVSPPMLVLGVGVTLLALGVVHAWLALAVAGIVIAQFGPVLVARRAHARRKAAVSSAPGARGATRTAATTPDAPRSEGTSGLCDQREDE